MKLHRLDDHYSQDILTKIRDRGTGRKEFRQGLRKLGMLTGIRIAASMGYSDVEVETPLGLKARGVSLTEARSVVIINVLRAATPFVEGLLDVFTDARIGVVNAKRIETGRLSPEFEFLIDMPYFNSPKLTLFDTLIVADPMIASGSTIVAVLDRLLKTGQPKRIILASVISAPLGLEKTHAHYPDAEVYTVAVDEGLNEHGYIVPGLGDAGDRVCG
jgi:uracil phosphoribosyltransferase